MAGDRAAAVRSGDAVAEFARRGLLVSAHSADLNSYERYLAAPALTDVYFRDWDAALHRPPPRAGLHYARAASLFARGMALAHTGRNKEAISALLELQAESRRLTPLEHGRLVLLSRRLVASMTRPHDASHDASVTRPGSSPSPPSTCAPSARPCSRRGAQRRASSTRRGRR